MNKLEQKIMLQRKIVAIRGMQLKLSLHQQLKSYLLVSFLGGLVGYRFRHHMPTLAFSLIRPKLANTATDVPETT